MEEDIQQFTSAHVKETHTVVVTDYQHTLMHTQNKLTHIEGYTKPDT